MSPPGRNFEIKLRAERCLKNVRIREEIIEKKTHQKDCPNESIFNSVKNYIK